MSLYLEGINDDRYRFERKNRFDEIGHLGITVNTVAPRLVQTGYISRDFEDKLLPTIPLQRIGQPEEIADMILFLASEQARWLTGQVIKVSGGHAL